MFILGEPLTVNWKLITPSNNIIPLSNFDVILYRPDYGHIDHMGSLYQDTQDPTIIDSFRLSYTFTPDVKGVWRVVLTRGEPDSYSILMEHNITVHEPDTHIYKQLFIRSLDSSVSDIFSNTTLQEAE